MGGGEWVGRNPPQIGDFDPHDFPPHSGVNPMLHADASLAAVAALCASAAGI